MCGRCQSQAGDARLDRACRGYLLEEQCYVRSAQRTRGDESAGKANEAAEVCELFEDLVALGRPDEEVEDYIDILRGCRRAS